MEQEQQHMVDGIDIESDGGKIAFIRVFISNKDNSSIKVIHSGIKEAIKHFIDEGFDVIRRTSDDYKDDSPGMHVIVENMVSGTNDGLLKICSFLFVSSGRSDLIKRGKYQARQYKVVLMQ